MSTASYEHLAEVFAKAFCDTGGSISDALRVIDEYRAQLLARDRAEIQPQVVVPVAAKLFGISPKRIYGPEKHRTVCDARWVVARVLHDLGWASVQIGRVLGGRDHSTILHALACVQDRPELIGAAHDVLQIATGRREPPWVAKSAA